MSDPKRPGVLRVTINAEVEFTLEQLRELLQRPEVAAAFVQRIAVQAEPEPTRSPEEEAELQRKREQASRLIEAYRATLGEPVAAVEPALLDWLREWDESSIRRAIHEVSLVVGRLPSAQARYEYLKEVLREWRRERRKTNEGHQS